MSDHSPDKLAAFDQCLEEVIASVAEAINVYRTQIASGADPIGVADALHEILIDAMLAADGGRVSDAFHTMCADYILLVVAIAQGRMARLAAVPDSPGGAS